MADPITISAAVVGTAFLVEDVKFLWKQADTITTRYNERKYRQIDDAEQAKIKVEDTPAVLQPAPELTIDFDRAQEKGAKMVMLSEALEPYAKGQKVARADDPDLLQTMDALQQMIEYVTHYQFQVTPERAEIVNQARAGGKIEMEESTQSIKGTGTIQNIAACDDSSIKIGVNIQEIEN